MSLTTKCEWQNSVWLSSILPVLHTNTYVDIPLQQKVGLVCSTKHCLLSILLASFVMRKLKLCLLVFSSSNLLWYPTIIFIHFDRILGIVEASQGFGAGAALATT